MKIIRMDDVLHHLHAPVVDADKIAEEVWEVLKRPQFRKSSAADLQNGCSEMYTKQICHFIERGEPIQFVLIAFPWKVWRMPLKTNRKTPDLGELAFLAQIARIDQEIRLKYSPGTHWTFLTEGEAYIDLFNVPQQEIDAYVSGVKQFASVIGQESLFSFVPFKSVLDQFPDFPDRFQEVHASMREEFSTSNGTIPKKFRPFFGTFYSSQDLRHVDLGTIRKVFHQKSADAQTLSPTETDLQTELGTKAKEMVLQYLAFNTAKHRVGNHGAVQDTFPHHIYISITQKPGRYALFPIHPKARLLPHHGVPVVRSDGRITIDWLDSILHSESDFTPIFVEGDTEDLPFYYQERV